jgi:hypothetical protein
VVLSGPGDYGVKGALPVAEPNPPPGVIGAAYAPASGAEAWTMADIASGSRDAALTAEALSSVEQPPTYIETYAVQRFQPSLSAFSTVRNYLALMACCSGCCSTLCSSAVRPKSRKWRGEPQCTV